MRNDKLTHQNENQEKYISEFLLFISKKLWITSNSNEYWILFKVMDFLKDKYNWKTRENWEMYITHFVETTKILTQISSKLTLKQVIIALLHDSIEDLNEVCVNEITRLFWYEIANSILKLSKRQKSSFISSYWQILREQENKEYFLWLWHLEDDELEVKLADRIHNLTTLYRLPLEKVKRKMQETREYFLPIAKERNIEAYKLIQEQLIYLQIYVIREESTLYMNT